MIMKFTIATILLINCCFAQQPKNIYDFQLTTMNNQVVNFSSFIGKKIIVSTFDAANPDVNQLLYLDSLQSASSNIKVVLVPARDFSPTINLSTLTTQLASLNLKSTLVKPLLTRKTAGAKQDELFQWLTNSTANIHFNLDISGSGQMFGISEKGTLYAVFLPGTSKNILNNVMNQTVNE
jgi:glutathione peroxidase-family protein